MPNPEPVNRIVAKALEPHWIIGWENIRIMLGASASAIKFWSQEYGFPLRYLPSNRPAIVMAEVDKWLQEYSDIMKSLRAIKPETRNKRTVISIMREAKRVGLI